MSAQVLRGDARALPLSDASVDLIVTSPPYWALRSYTDGGEHYAGQIGSEPTPAEYVASLIECTREWMRVLKPSGSMWINLGDKYSGAGRGNHDSDRLNNTVEMRAARLRNSNRRQHVGVETAPPKSLLGLPWRYAIRCIDDLGLILRAEVIWSKPNGLPESVTDRVRRSHEQWFHFVRTPRYFAAVDTIREAYDDKTAARYALGYNASRRVLAGASSAGFARSVAAGDTGPTSTNPLGKLPGSVWEIDDCYPETVTRSVLQAVAAGALTIDEAERIVWSTFTGSGPTSASTTAAGNGSACSTPTVTAGTTPSTSGPTEPIESPTNSQSVPSLTGSPSTTHAATSGASDPTTSSPSATQSTSIGASGRTDALRDTPTPATTSSCVRTVDANAESACAVAPSNTASARSAAPPSVWQIATQPLKVPAELGIDHFAAFPMEWPRRVISGWSPEGGIVVDPFGGTGTTALVADALGRHGISVDMSADYCRLARWRVADPGQRAAALEVPKPDPQHAGQLDLFGLAGVR